MLLRWVVAGTAQTLSQRPGLEFIDREVRWSRLRSWGVTLGQPGESDLEREAKMPIIDNTVKSRTGYSWRGDGKSR